MPTASMYIIGSIDDWKPAGAKINHFLSHLWLSYLYIYGRPWPLPPLIQIIIKNLRPRTFWNHLREYSRILLILSECLAVLYLFGANFEIAVCCLFWFDFNWEKSNKNVNRINNIHVAELFSLFKKLQPVKFGPEAALERPDSDESWRRRQCKRRDMAYMLICVYYLTIYGLRFSVFHPLCTENVCKYEM